MLHGQRAVSRKLDGFEFRYRGLRAALEDALASARPQNPYTAVTQRPEVRAAILRRHDARLQGVCGGCARLLGLIAVAVLAVAAPALALAHGSAKVVGNPKAGQAALRQHLRRLPHAQGGEARSGTIGPNLDKVHR